MSPSSDKPILLVLGGAGAQNGAVIKTLSAAGKWNIKLLTRSAISEHAAEVGDLPGVELIEGTCYNEADLVSSFRGADLCFVNTNGFAVGEKNEIYWGIRIYEIARWAGVKHLIYSSLPYVSMNGNFDPARRVPFVDGKAKVAQYLASMPTEPMTWSVVSSGPYAERLFDSGAPTRDSDGTYVFSLPLGPDGAMPLVALDDLAWYVQWMLENKGRAAGINLGIAIAHVTGQELANAFEAVTGKRARYDDIPLKVALDRMPKGKVGIQGSPGYDDPTLHTVEEHFGPWFGIFRDSGGNTGCWKRDYELMDTIFPDRIRTVEEWMRRVGYTGEPKQILKTSLSFD